jgi:hypothetical protein
MALMSGLWDYANKKAEERILELTFKSWQSNLIK